MTTPVNMRYWKVQIDATGDFWGVKDELFLVLTGPPTGAAILSHLSAAAPR
jgi:hypothetical protein